MSMLCKTCSQIGPSSILISMLIVIAIITIIITVTINVNSIHFPKYGSVTRLLNFLISEVRKGVSGSADFIVKDAKCK